MKRVVGPAGYTIVETMIFLTVSAMLFVSASVLITGRQRKTQFATTVREFASKLESVNGNVASGYYNSSGTVKCEVGGGKITKLESGGNEQGTNGDCIYLGQIVVSPVSGQSDFKIISLVGLRTTGTPAEEVDNLADAKPSLYTETADTYTLEGADFAWVKVGDVQVGTDTDSSVGFISSFGAFNSAKSLQSGSSHTDVYTINSSDTSHDGAIEDALRKKVPSAITPTNEKINYCLTNGEQGAVVTMVGGTTSYVIGDASLCS